MAIENIGLFPINIDVYKKHAISTVQANDNDMNGRGLLIGLVNDGVPINSTGITLKIGFRNAIGEERIYDCDIVDVVTGKYKVFYPTEMLIGNGGRVVKVEIKAYEPNGALLNYAPMFVYVSASEIPDSATLSTNEGSLLTKAITEYEGVNASYVIDEGARSTSENARVTAEGSRATAETARVGAESSRVTAEGSRVTAEGSRVTAETNRATFYDGFNAQLGEIATAIIPEKRISTSNTPIIKDLSLYTSPSGATRLYVVPNVLPKGIISVCFKAISVPSSGFFYLVERVGTTTTFNVIKKFPVNYVIGENNIYTDIIPKGNGQEYLAFSGINLAYKSSGGTGFYFFENFNSASTSVTTGALALNFDFGMYLTHSDSVIVSRIQDVENQIDTNKKEVDDISIYPLSKYRKSANINPNYLTDAYFLGRWFKTIVSTKNVMVTINQGSEIHVKINNTTTVGASFVLNNNGTYYPYIAVSIDGGAYTRHQVLGGDIVFATGLDLKEHYIRIVVSGVQPDAIWIDAKGLAFEKMNVDAGGTVEPVKPYNRKGLYIGDSITGGFLILGAQSLPQYSAAELGYTYISSKLMNAVPMVVGFGSTGVTVGGSGDVPNALTYVDYTKQSLLEETDIPDYIVANLGTNDGASNSATFQTAYTSLIKRLKAKYPGTIIFCVRPFNGAKASDILTVATNQGVEYVNTEGWGISFTDGIHPNTSGHLTAGIKLADVISAKLKSSYFNI